MAKSCICYNLGKAFINSSGTFIFISTVSLTSTLTLAKVFASTEAFASAQTLILGPPSRYIDENL